MSYEAWGDGDDDDGRPVGGVKPMAKPLSPLSHHLAAVHRWFMDKMVDAETTRMRPEARGAYTRLCEAIRLADQSNFDASQVWDNEP